MRTRPGSLPWGPGFGKRHPPRPSARFSDRTRTASVFYSLVTTCKQRGIDPRTYLRDAMLRLKEGVDPKTLTPKEWQLRYAGEVAERRNFVLAQILGKLGA